MTELEIKTMPTNELIDNLNVALHQENQFLINILAFEIACRVYVPFKGVSFDDLVVQYGYKEINYDKSKIYQK